MISSDIRKLYKLTVGIECHVQLKTKTKLFAAVDNDAREAEPNTLVSHICFGLPGALPVLNREAVYLAIRAAFALGTKPALFSKFDRKHYFYPDLPKGYQISQFDEPIITGGVIEIPLVDEATKERHLVRVGITRAHLEEDAGKSTHPVGMEYSLVDLNRAGTPLLEIVSEPDMHSSAEAKAYARELYLRMKYAEVSDCDLYLGHMRFDVNVSVSKNDTLGTRTETKNLNSFRSIEKAIEYEIDRQIELLEKGQHIVQETRGWDDAKQRTFSQRTKEEAHDYRYMPDPDLPPIVLNEQYVDEVGTDIPLMPEAWRARLYALGLDISSTETLIEAEVEHGQVSYLPLIALLLDQPDAARQTANWQINVEIPLRREGKLTQFLNDHDRLAIYKWTYISYKEKKLNSNQAREFLIAALEHPDALHDLEAYAANNGFLQVSDTDEIAKIVGRVLQENAKAADDVKNGEMKAIGFLVGQVMKVSKGKANPALAQELIKKALDL